MRLRRRMDLIEGIEMAETEALRKYSLGWMRGTDWLLRKMGSIGILELNYLEVWVGNRRAGFGRKMGLRTAPGRWMIEMAGKRGLILS